MAYHLNASLPPTLRRTPACKVPSLSRPSSWSSSTTWKNIDGRKVNRRGSRCKGNRNPSVFAVLTPEAEKQETDTYIIRLNTLGDCKLGISGHSFEYNGQGGQGIGRCTKVKCDRLKEENISASFHPKTMRIPSISGATTNFHGFPFPPFLRVDIVPQSLEGTINERTGKVDFKLRANYIFSVGNDYKTPPLLVNTSLTSEELNGTMIRRMRGKRVTRDGKCRLVGVTRVGRTDNPYINSLLNLPIECFIDLNVMISFF